MSNPYFDATCPFCGEDEDFAEHISQDVQQYSHSTTEHRVQVCDTCGYERHITNIGNVRRTSTQPWQKTGDREQMPDNYCLVYCPACEEVLGAAQIGESVECVPHEHTSDCCNEPVKVAYTFDDVPGHQSIDEEIDYFQVSLRQLRPHLDEGLNARVYRPRSVYTASDREISYRVGHEAVEIDRRDAEPRTFRTLSPQDVEEKLRRNPGFERTD